MGIQDRDYIRNERPRRISGPGWSVNTWIIAVNVVAYLASTMIVRRITFSDGTHANTSPVWQWGYFSLDTVAHGQVWRLLTFQFLHSLSSINHIVFNMIGLAVFGRLVEQYLGGKRYLAFYLLSGIGGPLGYIALTSLKLLNYSPTTPLVGASAGVFGVLIACALIAPNARVQLMFPPIEMTMKTMAWVYLGIAAFTVLTMGRTGGGNAGGEAAHLGGAAVGYLLISQPRLLNWADRNRYRIR